MGRILIVGGGIAGLSVATALHQRGLMADLIERNPTWQVSGAGILVQANAVRSLRALGMADALENAGTVVPRWDFCDAGGTVLCSIDLQDLWAGVGPCIGVERAQLQQVLMAGAEDVPCRLRTSVTALESGENRVRARLSDGSAREYDLVVGADGIASTIRKLAFEAAPPKSAGHVGWRSLVPARPSGLRHLQFFLGEGCFFGLCPVGRSATYGFGHVNDPELRDRVEGRLERLRSRFATFGRSVQEYLCGLERDEQIHCSTIEWIEQDDWVSGRVVLIGDAAHASSPIMGQGGSLAIEDALVLAECFDSIPSIAEALEAYTRRRKPRVQWVQRESIALFRQFREPAAVRDAFLRTQGQKALEDRFRPLIAVP